MPSALLGNPLNIEKKIEIDFTIVLQLRSTEMTNAFSVFLSLVNGMCDEKNGQFRQN